MPMKSVCVPFPSKVGKNKMSRFIYTSKTKVLYMMPCILVGSYEEFTGMALKSWEEPHNYVYHTRWPCVMILKTSGIAYQRMWSVAV